MNGFPPPGYPYPPQAAPQPTAPQPTAPQYPPQVSPVGGPAPNFGAVKDFAPEDHLPRLPYGRFLLEAQKVFERKTFKGDFYFVLEAKVVESTSPELNVGDTTGIWFNVGNDPYGKRAAEIGALLGAFEGFDARDKVKFDAQFKPNLDAWYRHSVSPAAPYIGKAVQAAKSYREKKDGSEGWNTNFAPPHSTPLTFVPEPAGARASAAPVAAPPMPPQGFAPPMPTAPVAAPVASPCPPGVDPATWAAFCVSQGRR